MSNAPDPHVSGPDELDRGINFQSLVASSADVNVVATHSGVYRYVSPACTRLFGWAPFDLEGHIEDDFVHPDDRTVVREARAGLRGAEFITTSYRFLCRDGRYRWTETTSRLVADDGAVLLVSTMRDITARQKHEAELEFMARTDPLTGVANRTVLMDRLQQSLRRMNRVGHGLAVLYIDIDHFKVINDSLGHRVGDKLLLDVAVRLTHSLRPSDTLARLGGDEFVLVAEDVPREEAAIDLASRVIQVGHQTFQIDDESFECTLSIGVAWTTNSRRDPEDLLREADLALYRAKDRGRDRVEVFDELLRTSAANRMVTERLLRRAIGERRLVVEYQPIVDIQEGLLVGVEALVRISDHTNELLQPDSFLGVAEETGIVTEIDDLVLADSIDCAIGWQHLGRGSGLVEVSVNITARHLADASFAQSVVEKLDSVGLPHQALQVELTERTLMRASNSSLTALRSLREAGVLVGLDDFGTGYSSLAYLRQFPLDFVKIDRSFVHDLERSSADRAIVQAIIGLSHALKLHVIAEGVETESQLNVLRALHCDRGQGFLFARSASPDVVSDLITGGLPSRPAFA